MLLLFDKKSFLQFRRISGNKRTQKTLDNFFLPKKLKVEQNLDESIPSTFRSEIGSFAEETTDIRLPCLVF